MIRFIASFLLIFIFLSGCRSSKKSPSSPPLEEFSLSSEMKKKLSGVGCRQEEYKFVCDPVKESSSSTVLKQLEFKQGQYESREKVFKELKTELDKASKRGNLTSQSKFNLMLMSLSSQLRLNHYSQQVTVLGIKIGQEDRYNQIIGYKCAGKVKTSSVDSDFSESILFKRFETSDEVEGSKSEGLVQFKHTREELYWALGTEPGKTKDKNARGIWVKANREFKVEMELSNNPAELIQYKNTCRQERQHQVQSELTERPILRQALTCQIIWVKPESTPGDDSSDLPLGYEMYFGVKDERETAPIDYNDLIGVDNSGSLAAEYKYAGVIESHQGNIIFKVIQIDSNKVVASVTTVNTANQIDIGFSDYGNAVRFKCRPPS